MFSYIQNKVYCHGSSNMLSLPFSLMLANSLHQVEILLVLPISLNQVLPWECTISTYGLSKILQVSCHVACNKKLLSKYVWFISVEKISFIWSCDMEEIKATDCIIKVHITSGNIKWCSFALIFRASNHESACQPLLPSAKGLSFTFVLFLMQETWWSSPFLFTFYPLARTLCWKDPDILYIKLDVS